MTKILHVDDDSSDQELTRFNLGRLADDIRVDWADSGQQALDMLASADYDAILCDYQMWR
jgi:CheY-like chemotaxis protein